MPESPLEVSKGFKNRPEEQETEKDPISGVFGTNRGRLQQRERKELQMREGVSRRSVEG